MASRSSDEGGIPDRAIVESLVTGILHIADGVVTYVNPSARLILEATLNPGDVFEWPARWRWVDGGPLPAWALPDSWEHAGWDMCELNLVDEMSERVKVTCTRQPHGFTIELARGLAGD